VPMLRRIYSLLWAIVLLVGFLVIEVAFKR